MIVRPAGPGDAGAIAALYAHHVLHGTGSFEETPPTPEVMAGRMADVAARGLPWFVAEKDGRLLGYAYAAPFRLRAAYRFTAEDSVYVAPDAMGRGVGKAVLSAVVQACRAAGLRQLLSVIGGSDNLASIALHESLGFSPVGVTPALGWKHDTWLDVVWMQLPLNGGSGTAPDAPGLILP